MHDLLRCSQLTTEIKRLKRLNECACCATDKPDGPNPALMCRQCAKEAYDEQQAEIERLRRYEPTHKALRWYLGARGVNEEEAAMASQEVLKQFQAAEPAKET